MSRRDQSINAVETPGAFAELGGCRVGTLALRIEQ
jgi:hypothetical protein